MDRKTANLFGIAALLMWSIVIGLLRSVTQSFGVVEGTALVYTLGAVSISLKGGLPKISKMPRAYLFGAGGAFVLYEIIFSQAVGMAEDARQALEVGILNYLWPCSIVVLSIWINNQKMNWLVWPGTAVSIIGLYWCIAPGNGLTFSGMISNFLSSPLPYILGLLAAIIWGVYCNLSARFSQGHNGIPIFFIVIACALWVNFFLRGGELHFPGIVPLIELLVVGLIFGVSYSMWEKGMYHGNFMMLATLSYLNPAASMFFASTWLGAPTPLPFWIGVSLIIMGSVLCSLARRRR
ncbi:MAG: aromatic amino acid DMT transporter YddG [Desulfovibrionaceae bacterium]|nr:aromatic amino acid DMT transporter YddG [Desulfovibrionaceae bacterium]